MTEEGIWNAALYDETPLETFLLSKLKALEPEERKKELIIQQKALTRDLNYLSVLCKRLEETLGVLQILAVDGCSLNTRHHHEQTRDVLQERITFFEHVVLQRKNAIHLGNFTLEKSQGLKEE